MNTIKFTLASLFVTSLIVAQIISAKLLFVSLPLLGAVAMPGGTIAYALTFFSTDCINELYGKEQASTIVNIAFGMNFVLLALVYLTIWWPHAGGVPQETFQSALAPAANIVVASLVAYVISQHLDVRVFAAIRKRTEARILWLRNIGSTTISQFVDTVLFTVVAFILAPMVFGVGSALPLSVVGSLIVGQFVVKALIALVDTPIVYAVVGAIKRSEPQLIEAGRPEQQ